MLLKMAEAARHHPFTLAMLCKTGVARKALEHYWINGLVPQESALYRVDAAAWFDASVDACLFLARFASDPPTEKSALLYEALDSAAPATRFGLVDGQQDSRRRHRRPGNISNDTMRCSRSARTPSTAISRSTACSASAPTLSRRTKSPSPACTRRSGLP